MPAVNPLISDSAGYAAAPVAQGGQPAMSQAGGTLMQPAAPDQATQVNAAGTSENVAMHVALAVAAAYIGLYVLKQSGFKFVASGKIG